MLKIKYAVAAVVAFAGAASAQWSNIAPDHIGNTNAGSVAVGVTNPAQFFGKITVRSTGGLAGTYSLNIGDGGTGIWGECFNVNGVGVRGIAGVQTTGWATGVFGQSFSPAGTGVIGVASANTGSPIGLYGESQAPNGFGFYSKGPRNYIEGTLGVNTFSPTTTVEVNGTFAATGFRSATTSVANAPNLRNGAPTNTITSGAYAATISGGGSPGGIFVSETPNVNSVTDAGGTVAGGVGNRAGDNSGTQEDAPYASVGGGLRNTASAQGATVAGGRVNLASGLFASVNGGEANTSAGTWAGISGGTQNQAAGQSSYVGGGSFNVASGTEATIPGGRLNSATGLRSFAFGHRAKAVHNYAMVWNNASSADVSSTADSQYIINSTGGVWIGSTAAPVSIPGTVLIATDTGATLTTGGTWTNSSDRNLKENFREVSPRDMLAAVAAMPITRWNYKKEGATVDHIGPTAQDFRSAFGLGINDTSISTVDASGVALAAIKGLDEVVKEKDAQIRAQQNELNDLKARLAALEALIKNQK